MKEGHQQPTIGVPVPLHQQQFLPTGITSFDNIHIKSDQMEGWQEDKVAHNRPRDDEEDGHEDEPEQKQRKTSSRRFLSACMEGIEPVVEQRGKDTMYQCPYCGKLCTMSGTRALSKHIDNEHRPLAVLVNLTDLSMLNLSMSKGSYKILYILFTPMERWHVNVSAGVRCLSMDGEKAYTGWVSLKPLPVSEYTAKMKYTSISSKSIDREKPDGQELHMKIASAAPYLPRPTWDEKVHSRQRVGMWIGDDLKAGCEKVFHGQSPSAGFALHIDTASLLKANEDLQQVVGEVDINLGVHGKETSVVLPLSIGLLSMDQQYNQGVAPSMMVHPNMMQNQFFPPNPVPGQMEGDRGMHRVSSVQQSPSQMNRLWSSDTRSDCSRSASQNPNMNMDFQMNMPRLPTTGISPTSSINSMGPPRLMSTDSSMSASRTGSMASRAFSSASTDTSSSWSRSGSQTGLNNPNQFQNIQNFNNVPNVQQNMANQNNQNQMGNNWGQAPQQPSMFPPHQNELLSALQMLQNNPSKGMNPPAPQFNQNMTTE